MRTVFILLLCLVSACQPRDAVEPAFVHPPTTIPSETAEIPIDAPEALLRAHDAFGQGRFAEAVALLNVFIPEVPDTTHLSALLLRAEAQVKTHHFLEALRDYRQTLYLHPGHPVAVDWQTRILQADSTVLSAALLEVAAQLQERPDDLPLWLSYADALREQAAYTAAAEAYATYLTQAQGALEVIQHYLITLAGYQEGIPQGEQEALRYLQLYPDEADLWMRLGYFRLWQQKHPEAQSAFQRALTLDPANVDAQAGLKAVEG